MAVVGTALLGKVMSHTQAERAFQPWWDTTQEFIAYGLVILGLVTLPTAMFSATPLDCNICTEEDKNCEFMKGLNNFNPITNKTSAPSYNAWWVKKYCTMTAVDEFTLYFPYILIIIPLIMVAIEKGFVKVSKSNVKMESFYNLLVKEVTEEETANTKNTVSIFMENRKDVIKLSQQFLIKELGENSR